MGEVDNKPNQDNVIDQLLSSISGSDNVVSESIAKEQALIRIRVEKRRAHYVTIIEVDSNDAKSINLEEVAKQLKRKLAAGGTVKDNRIEIQGDHRYKIRKLLLEEGFNEDNIFIDENITVVQNK
ncbi:translation initiation factor [Caldivirga maquilingensis]|uniref:translation initiation factor n=1 Tax=Caldivirga maquilingensis TaxID=76887 RepID=UPI000A42B71B